MRACCDWSVMVPAEAAELLAACKHAAAPFASPLLHSTHSTRRTTNRRRNRTRRARISIDTAPISAWSISRSGVNFVFQRCYFWDSGEWLTGGHVVLRHLRQAMLCMYFLLPLPLLLQPAACSLSWTLAPTGLAVSSMLDINLV